MKLPALTCFAQGNKIMVVFIVIILVFFIILSLVYLLASLYNKDRNIVGGAVLMLLTMIIFLVLFLFSVHERRQKNQTGMNFPIHLA